MTEHSWFGPASQASQQCSQDLHTMFPLLPPSSAFYENSQDEYPADGPHNVSSRTMTARTVTMSQPPPAAPPPRPEPRRPPEASQGDTAPVVDDEQPTPVCYACRILARRVVDEATGTQAFALRGAQSRDTAPPRLLWRCPRCPRCPRCEKTLRGCAYRCGACYTNDQGCRRHEAKCLRNPNRQTAAPAPTQRPAVPARATRDAPPAEAVPEDASEDPELCGAFTRLWRQDNPLRFDRSAWRVVVARDGTWSLEPRTEAAEATVRPRPRADAGAVILEPPPPPRRPAPIVVEFGLRRDASTITDELSRPRWDYDSDETHLSVAPPPTPAAEAIAPPDDDEAFAPPPDDDAEIMAPPAGDGDDDGDDDARPAATWAEHDRRATRKARKAERAARRARKAERRAARQRERDARAAAAAAPADQIAALDALVDAARDDARRFRGRVQAGDLRYDGVVALQSALLDASFAAAAPCVLGVLRRGAIASTRRPRRAPAPAPAFGCARCRHAAGGCLACRPAGVLPPGAPRIGDAPPARAPRPAGRAARPAAPGGGNALKGRGPTNRGRAKRARPASQGAPEPNWDDLPDGHAAGDAPATSVPRPRPRRRCVRSPHRDRDADAALGHAIALSYAQGPGAWGANHIIMPDGARFSMLEADPMKLTYY